MQRKGRSKSESRVSADRRFSRQALEREIDARRRIENELASKNMRMEEELRLAAEFQQAVLPTIIDLPYLRTAIIFEPYHQVSGDVYDFLLNREQELGVFLGDATGHGVVAALMTMMVHLGLDSLRRDLPTDETIRRLNRLIAFRETGRSVTGLFFRINPAGQLFVTHAAHPSLIVMPADGSEPVQFEKGGCALGGFLEEPVPYEEECINLQRGDRIFAYTDGLTECRDKHDQLYGLDRLLDFLRQNRSTGFLQLRRGLMQELENFAHGNPLKDDLTALIFEYTGGPEH